MRPDITENLRTAVTELAIARRDLQATMPHLTALEFLVLWPLLERCSALATDLEALRGAIIKSQ